MTNRRRTFCLIATVAIVTVALACLAPELAERFRLAAIQQTVRLTDSVSMRVHDACIYPADATHELLRIYVSYEGGDPNRDFHMRAEIGRSPIDMTFAGVWHWQVPLPGSGMDKFWEFQNYPRDGRPFFIRLYLRPKAGGEEIVRVFEVPDRLKYTPNGEWPTKKITGNDERDAGLNKEGNLAVLR